MARLSEIEKEQLLKSSVGWPPERQPVIRLSSVEYMEFLTFAARFTRQKKAMIFTGKHWKL